LLVSSGHPKLTMVVSAVIQIECAPAATASRTA
jgi:hypothetical protein